MTNPTLKELSEKATAGEWSWKFCDDGSGAVRLHPDGKPRLEVVRARSLHPSAGNPDITFICALVNAFRSGSLVPVERVNELEKALKPFLFLFDRNDEGKAEDQLEGLPDSHGFELVWETDEFDKAPVITAGQVRIARTALSHGEKTDG